MKKIFSLILAGVVVGLTFFGLGNFIIAADSDDVGIHLTEDCLSGMGSDCMDYGKMMGIDKEQPDYTPTSIVQDVILAATYMVGTVLTIVIIVCGLGYIFSSASGKDISKYKKGLVSAAIGAVLVRGAYAIVRLIQYIAKG